MGKMFLLNAPVITAYGNYRFSGPLTPGQATLMLQEGFESAIGHDGTAQWLEDILQVSVPVKRQRIEMQVGDRALVFRLLHRMPEGRVLNKYELKDLQYELSLLERLA